MSFCTWIKTEENFPQDSYYGYWLLVCSSNPQGHTQITSTSVFLSRQSCLQIPPRQIRQGLEMTGPTQKRLSQSSTHPSAHRPDLIRETWSSASF